jgi:pimeloyl-ACP methyl ester carboxylesterase
MHATQLAREVVVTDSVSSTDGTTIGYRRLGRGPGVVVLHGAVESAASHLELALALADDYTVYLPDRRGRGTSGPYGTGYGIQKEVEDLDRLLDRTGARYVFGVSSGALIALHAALTLPDINKAVIFEPPLNVHGSVSTAFLPRYDEEIATGKVAAALVSGMQAAQMGPPIFSRMPRWLLETLTKLMLASEDRHARVDDVTMSALAPTLHYDFQLVIETYAALERYRAIAADVLLPGGSESPAYLKTALDALERVLPHERRVELAGAGHGASGNRNRGGNPALVAPEVRRFFA